MGPRTLKAIPTCRAGVAVLACAAAAPTQAQSNVDPTDKFSWNENCGWMNWHDAGTSPGQHGVFAHYSSGYLSGFIWCENIGWVNIGNGNGPYLNTTGENSGVNLAPNSGILSGLAWSENAGWINFAGGAMTDSPNPARLDPTGLRLRGYAWSENVGWINLDVASDSDNKFVAFIPDPVCDSIDFNGDALLPDIQDLIDFVRVFAGGVCEGQLPGETPCNSDIDFNNDDLFPDVQDIGSLIRVFAGGTCV